ncbi:MAG: lytic transglycosylase domain-containing protein [Atopobiaceae bacterium]
MRSGSERFLRWYRALPLFCMACMLALSLGIEVLPSEVVRRVLYPVSYATQINGAAARYDVDPYLVAAVIKSESNWDPAAASQAGAQGLMQLMPATAQELADLGMVDTAEYDPKDLLDPSVNIEYGTAYLAYLSRQLSSTEEVIAAYNAGVGTVKSWLTSSQNSGSELGLSTISDAITYPETRLYLARVQEARAQYARYYPDGLKDF